MVLTFSEKEPALKSIPEYLFKNFEFHLPKYYLNILKENDGGSLYYDFAYYDKMFKERMLGGISILFGLRCGDEENLIYRYKDLPDFFPKGLVPFGENGGGNFICFDYRKVTKGNNPPIVYWIHEYEDGKNISSLANNFKEFIEMLKDPESEIVA